MVRRRALKLGFLTIQLYTFLHSEIGLTGLLWEGGTQSLTHSLGLNVVAIGTASEPKA